MKKLIAALCLLSLGLGNLFATTAFMGCPDFTDLTASYVEPFASGVGKALVKGRHTVISEQGTDPRTGDQLQLLPEGVDKVVKLGNELAGTENESLTYHFKPSFENHLLMVKFAVVFENPDHSIAEQPYFSISITDTAGRQLAKTLSYEVYAKDGLKDFNEYVDGASRVLWRDWTDVLVDLGLYMDQEVLITFKTRDCLQNGHYAYAYFSSTCMANEISMNDCGKDNVVISLLDGFLAYLWNNGDVTKTYTGSLDDPVWCDVTSVFGSTSRQYVSVVDKDNPTPDVIHATVCEGAEYYWNGHLINTNYQGTRCFSGVEVDPVDCTSKMKKLVLKTTPTHYFYKATICEGEDYTENGFKIKNPPVGKLCDTIKVASDNSCPRWNILTLEVVPNSITPTLAGNENPCTENVHSYSVPSELQCEWTLPNNAVLSAGKPKGPKIDVVFKGTEPGYITAKCSNGCATQTLTMQVKPAKTVRTYVIDTICQGLYYKKDGWDLGIQNKPGYTTHIKQLGDSCGSSEILALYVLESPNVSIKADSVVCRGTTVSLTTADTFAVVDKYVATGDVLCNDGSILHFNDFLESGKEAKGIVFKVDSTGLHGFAVAVDEYMNGNIVEYDRATMNEDQDIPEIDDAAGLLVQQNLVNSELEKIPGAVPLDLVYWTKTRYNDTDNIVLNFDYNSVNSFDHQVMTRKFKIRKVYTF